LSFVHLVVSILVQSIVWKDVYEVTYCVSGQVHGT